MISVGLLHQDYGNENLYAVVFALDQQCFTTFFFTNSCWIRVEKNEMPSDIVWANAAPMATIAVVRHFFSMTHVLIPSFSLTLTLSVYFPLAMSYITIELYFPSFRLFY